MCSYKIMPEEPTGEIMVALNLLFPSKDAAYILAVYNTIRSVAPLLLVEDDAEISILSPNESVERDTELWRLIRNLSDKG